MPPDLGFVSVTGVVVQHGELISFIHPSHFLYSDRQVMNTGTHFLRHAQFCFLLHTLAFGYFQPQVQVEHTVYFCNHLPQSQWICQPVSPTHPLCLSLTANTHILRQNCFGTLCRNISNIPSYQAEQQQLNLSLALHLQAMGSCSSWYFSC